MTEPTCAYCGASGKHRCFTSKEADKCPNAAVTENTHHGWRNMASAPRDGTPVLLRSNDTGLTYCAGWTVLGSDRGARWQSTMLDQGGYSDEYFDGWMPMPHPDTGFADSLVVSEELKEKLTTILSEYVHAIDRGMRAAPARDLTRAKILEAVGVAKTEAQVRESVIEELAQRAETTAALAFAELPEHFAHWLRSQKGQTNG